MAFGIKAIQNGAVLAAGSEVHPAPITVDPHVLIYLSFTGSTEGYAWALPTRPVGSLAVISSATSPGPTLTTDLATSGYSVTLVDDDDNLYVLDIENATVPPTARATASVEVSSFGGGPNAAYFHTNGKWYTDSTHTVEASDDAGKFILAMAYVEALGGGSVHFGAGNWYFRDAPTGSNGEYVVVPDNVTVWGDGDASCITISPGRMTGATNTGYSCVFGLNATPSGVLDNVRFRNFRVDHNSAHNQMAAAGGAGLTYPYAATIIVPKGTAIRCEGITTVNHAGRFGIGIIYYGYADEGANAIIDGCQFLHEGDDPHVGDTSVVFCSATNAQISNCIVDADLANSVAWPNGNPVISAFEIHSSNCIFSNNVARDTGRLLNLAGDSLSQNGFIVHGNVGDGVVSGITLYQTSGNSITNLEVIDNILKIRQGTAAFGEVGIAVADPAALSLSDGNGIINARFSRNQIAFTYTITTDPVTGLPVTPGPTPNKSYGMNMLGIANRVEIDHNLISGFGYIGCLWNATTRAANAGNLNQDMYIHSNLIYRSGAYGIFLGGKVGESSPVLIRTRIENNRIIDDRGGSSTLGYGVYINGYVDSSLRRWWNTVVGATTADYFLDTVNYPTSATLPETTSGSFKAAGDGVFTGSMRIGGTSTAQQTLHVTGGALISLEYLQNADNSGAAITWSSNEFNVYRDAHYLKSASGGSTFLTATSSGLTPGVNFLDMPYVTWTKKTDPSAPAANKGVMYLRDNGAGKMQLVAKFPTGAVQVIATEP